MHLCVLSNARRHRAPDTATDAWSSHDNRCWGLVWFHRVTRPVPPLLPPPYSNRICHDYPIKLQLFETNPATSSVKQRERKKAIEGSGWVDGCLFIWKPGNSSRMPGRQNRSTSPLESPISHNPTSLQPNTHTSPKGLLTPCHLPGFQCFQSPMYVCKQTRPGRAGRACRARRARHLPTHLPARTRKQTKPDQTRLGQARQEHTKARLICSPHSAARAL
jgi:hypothetical protein